ncbi:hypothetical protein TRFO_01022 [Tritrichomonas foetus]|uniref:Uncharacterized protein n=1 Tax=Tritrichomonas foetus TaxID=1144522 RepID=A0A1J4L2T0_9EUKA|nr:hypothetical protein TRFO_01022 [Tritrichomonas foetus]|eukprot:OHT17706.1 hypothetical protein TRFO_01022 [Tritrichomonas foetus]
MPPRPVPVPSSPSTVTSNTTTTTATTTTSKSKNSKSTVTTNVELEFTQRFLSLFTSFYETPSTDEILTFPACKPNPQADIKSPTRTPPFHSGVWDLRLKKAIDARITNDQLTSDSLSEQVLQLRETLASETPDLNDVFVPQKTERPQIPLYLQNIQKEEQITKDDITKRSKPISSRVAEMAQLFTERLRRQKQMSKERAKRRFMRAKELEKQHNDFVKTLHKTKIQDDYDPRITAKAKFKVLQEQREKQLQEGRKAVETMRAKSPVKAPKNENVITF